MWWPELSFFVGGPWGLAGAEGPCRALPACARGAAGSHWGMGELCTHPTHAASTGDLRETLRAVGLRATGPRLAVLECLRSAARPLTHSEVMDLIGDAAGLDRATVYRNLADLVKAGLLHRHDLGDHVWRFELGEDPCATSVHDEMGHPHFMCVECGDVTCLPGVLLSLPAKGGAPASVRAQAVAVQLRGVCDDCA